MNGPSIFKRCPSAFRVLALACFTAALGFTFALATTPDASVAAARAAHKAGSRAAIEPLRFTNPFLLIGTNPGADPLFFPTGGATTTDPQGFDLGDVSPNTDITRYVTATGGYLPYRFAAQSLPDPLAGSNAVPFAVPLRLPFGKMSTHVPETTGALRFSVLLSDFINTTRVGTFKMNVVNLGVDTLRFAQDRLPTAQQGRTYFTSLETVGGTGGVTFSVAEVTVNGATVARLEDTGLSLSSDGTLFGRPTPANDIKFTVLAHDIAGHSAKSRDGNAINQAFTITMEKGLPVSTEVAAVTATVRGNVLIDGTTFIANDSLTYSGYMDPKSETAATLAGTTFTLRIGRAGSPGEGILTGTFDAKGKVRKTIAASPTNKKGQLSVSYSPVNGRFTLKASGISLGTALGATSSVFTDVSYQPLILGFEIGNYRTTEVLQTQTKVRSGHFAMDYALGKRGFSRAGAMQVLSVRGTDSKVVSDNGGTSWLIKALGVPAQDSPAAAGTGTTGTTGTTTTTTTTTTPKSSFTAPTASATILAGTSATIEVGEYSQQITLALKSVRLEFKATSKDHGIYQVLLDPKKFVHRIQTNNLTLDDTGIPQAFSTKLPALLPVGIVIPNFIGHTGRVIVPDRGVWVQE
jgi:hypothetical protein